LKNRLKQINISLQRKIGFDLNFLTKNGSWMAIKEGIQILTSLINVLIFTRFLSLEVYGQFHFVIAIITVVAISSLPGMFASVARSVAQGFEGSVWQGFKKRVVSSFIGSLVLIFFGLYYYWLKDHHLMWAFFLGAAVLPALFSSELWWAYLIGKAQFELIAKRWILISVLMSFMLISSVFLFTQPLLPMIISFLLVTAGLNLFFLYKTKQKLTNSKITNETFSYGWFMTKMKGLDIIVKQIDKIIIGFVSMEVLAVFSVAQRMLEMLEKLLGSPFRVVFPKFATRKIQFIPNWLLICLFIIGVFISFSVALIAKPIIVLLFSTNYLESVEIFQILTFCIPFLLITALLKNVIEAQKQEKPLLHFHFHVPLITLVLSFTVLILTHNIYYFFFSKILSLKILEAVFLLFNNQKKTMLHYA